MRCVLLSHLYASDLTPPRCYTVPMSCKTKKYIYENREKKGKR